MLIELPWRQQHRDLFETLSAVSLSGVSNLLPIKKFFAFCIT